MKQRGIIFSGPLIPPILEDRKTQTRRLRGLDLINKDPSQWRAKSWGTDGHWLFKSGYDDSVDHLIKCPYGVPGDRLWVRETLFFDEEFGTTWYATKKEKSLGNPSGLDWGPNPPELWESPAYGSPVRAIHMPRWASRITLGITNIRVERVRDISREDALAEGVPSWVDGRILIDPPPGVATQSFCAYWEKLNGPGSWEQNPWVWVIEFNRKAT